VTIGPGDEVFAGHADMEDVVTEVGDFVGSCRLPIGRSAFPTLLLILLPTAERHKNNVSHDLPDDFEFVFVYLSGNILGAVVPISRGPNAGRHDSCLGKYLLIGTCVTSGSDVKTKLLRARFDRLYQPRGAIGNQERLDDFGVDQPPPASQTFKRSIQNSVREFVLPARRPGRC